MDDLIELILRLDDKNEPSRRKLLAEYYRKAAPTMRRLLRLHYELEQSPPNVIQLVEAKLSLAVRICRWHLSSIRRLLRIRQDLAAAANRTNRADSVGILRFLALAAAIVRRIIRSQSVGGFPGDSVQPQLNTNVTLSNQHALQVETDDVRKFHDLFEKYQGAMRRIIGYRIPGEQDREESLQDTYLRLREWVDRYGAELLTQGLFYSAARNNAINQNISRARRQAIQTEHIDQVATFDETTSDDDALLSKLHPCLTKLPEMDRELIIAATWDELSPQGVFQMFCHLNHHSPKTEQISNKTARALEKLITLLDDYER